MRFVKSNRSLLIALVLGRILLFSHHAAQLSAADPSVNAPSQWGTQPAKDMATRQLTVDKIQRSYLLHIPLGLDPIIPAPVILAFHGGAGTAEIFAYQTNLHAQAARVNFIVVYPQGYGRSWNAGDCCGPAMRRGINDVKFVKAILDDLASVVKVDPQRVFATGFSNGGKLVYRLACELSDQIAAIAPVGAAISLPASNCHPVRPISVLHFHGLADEYAPYEGGLSKFQPAGVQRSVRETIAFWLLKNRCTHETQVTSPKETVTCTTYPKCCNGAEVTLYTIEGMGHQWPGGRDLFPRRFGRGSTDISATDLIVSYFQRLCEKQCLRDQAVRNC